MFRNINTIYDYLNPRLLLSHCHLFKDDDKILKEIDDHVQSMESHFDAIIRLASSNTQKKIHLDQIFDIHTVDTVNTKKMTQSSDVLIYLDNNNNQNAQKNQTLIKRNDHYMDKDECILFPTNPSNNSIIHVTGNMPYCWTKSYIQLKPKSDDVFIPYIVYLLTRKISTISYLCDYDARVNTITTTVSIDELKKIDIPHLRKDVQIRIYNIYESIKSLNNVTVEFNMC